MAGEEGLGVLYCWDIGESPPLYAKGKVTPPIWTGEWGMEWEMEDWSWKPDKEEDEWDELE